MIEKRDIIKRFCVEHLCKWTGNNSAIARSKIEIMAFIAYVILSIIFTYPVAFSANMIPGDGGDAFWYLWDFWWFKEALSTLSNPYYTQNIFYPFGVNLIFSEVSPLNAAISVPLQSAFGLIKAYNIIWISTFILSGFNTFLLTKYLTGNRKAAFISGLIFMFCPYRFAHALGHMNLISTQWMILYILFLIKIINEDKRSNALLASLFLILTATSSWYYLIYLFVFTIIFIIYYKRADKLVCKKGLLKDLSLLVITSSIAISPLIYLMLDELITTKSNYMYGGGFIDYSSDLLGFIVPTLFHPFFKGIVTPIYSHFTGGSAEYTTFAGYTVILLALISILKVKTKDVRFWGFSAIIFSILSLGPILHVNGIFTRAYEGYNIVIPLPYAFLMHIPIFSLARIPSRWDVLVMLALAALAAYALNYISIYLMNLNHKNVFNALAFLISALILFEFLAVPYPMSSAEVPACYSQKIADDIGDFAIVEVPFTAKSMYYQTLHEKKLINGYVSRAPDSLTGSLLSEPFLGQLMRISYLSMYEDIIEQDMACNRRSKELCHYDVRYVVVHKDLISDEQFNRINAFLLRSACDPATNETDSAYVYALRNDPRTPLIELNDGWYGPEDWNGMPTRWIGKNASLKIYSEKNRPATLSLTALSFYCNRTLEIHAGKETISRQIVPTVFITVNMPINLKAGRNDLEFCIPEGCQRPCDIPEMKNGDLRCLGVAIQNVNLTYVT